MEKDIARVLKKFRQLEELWPDWDHPTTPVVFYTDDKALLFSHPDPPKEFKPTRVEELNAYICTPKPKYLTANTAMNIDEVSTATIGWRAAELASILALTAHECFHVYQTNAGFQLANIMLMAQYPVFDPLVNTLGEIEGKLLHKALITKDIHFAKQALDAHAGRQALLPLELQEYENRNELHEGLAVYIEMKAITTQTNRWQSNMNALSRINHNGEGASRQRFYYSGMAYGLLCDMWADDWQARIPHECSSLASLLSDAIGYLPDSERRCFEDIDFGRIFAGQQEDVQKRKQKIADEVRCAFPGTGVEIEAIFNSNPVSGGWNPYTVKVLPTGGRFHSTSLLYHYDSGAEISVASGAIELSNCSHIKFEAPNPPVLIDGVTRTTGTWKGNLEVEYTNYMLKMPKAQVEFDGRVITVEEIN